jgi:hypothetical protein
MGPPTAPSQVGQSFSIDATATDPDGDNLKVTHLGLPPGATLTPVNGTTQASPATATFEWTPSASAQGTGHSVLLVFTDTANQSCQTSFSVNIPSAPVNQAPTRTQAQIRSLSKLVRVQ